MQDLYHIEVDTHCHSVGSVHAFSTVDEIIKYASEKSLLAVAVTDHHGSLAHLGDDYIIHAPDDSYFHVFCNRLKITEPVRILKGIELNILDHSPWVIQPRSDLDPLFEIKLAGIHTLAHLYKKSSDRMHNTECILNALNSSNRPFHVFVHPCQKITPVHIEPVIRLCAEKNIALELNNSSLAYERDDIETVENMLKLVIQHDCHIVCGTDAHVPNEIADFSACVKMLEKMNFPRELVVNCSVTNLLDFLKIS